MSAPERDVRAAPQGALADARLRVVVAAEACETEAVRVERGYWMRRMQAVHGREGARRKALAAMVVRYHADTGPPETPEARADQDRARAWSEDCAVCGEDEPDAPRVAHDRVYCSDTCAVSAGCPACGGTGHDGPAADWPPCGECRPSDRAEYDSEEDDRRRSAADDARVDEARGK